MEFEYKLEYQKMIKDVGPIEKQDEKCWPTGDVLIRIPKQPERSKREDLNCNCHRCFKDNLLKDYYPWLHEQEMKAREGKILCEKIIQDAVL